MIRITFLQEDGTSRTVESQPGRSLMEAARAHDISNIIAECGGCLACGTCHVVVDDSWADRLPEADSMELEMIGGLENPHPNSRLSCQIALSTNLDGLAVSVPTSTSL